MFKRLKKKQKGFGLIEVVIALGLLGIVGIAFLGALATSSNAVMANDERATAESLARSQMEYVKSQDYYSAPWSYELPLPFDWPSDWLPDWLDPSDPPTLPEGHDHYTVHVIASPLDPLGDGGSSDEGLQKITVTVTFLAGTEDEKEVIVLEGYKMG